MQATILQALSDAEFSAEAYSDYLQSCATKYEEYIQMLEEMSLFDPEEDASTPASEYDWSEKAADVCLEHGIDPNAMVAFNEGYAKISDVLTCVGAKCDQFSDPESEDGHLALTEQALQLVNGIGTESNVIAISEVFTQAKSNLHATLVTSAAVLASKEQAVADRLAVYKDAIETKFANVYDDVSNVANYFKGMLQNASVKGVEIVKSITNSFGFDQMAADDDATIGESPLAAYTGASPAATVDFSIAKDVAATTGKALAIAAKGVLSAIVSIGKKVFTWTANQILDMFEPFDIEVCNKDASAYSVDGWDIRCDDEDMVWCRSKESLNQALEQGLLDSFIGKWTKYKTIFGEIIFKLEEVDTYTLGNTNPTYWAGIKAETHIKPYVLNVDALEALAEPVISSNWFIRPYNMTDVFAIQLRENKYSVQAAVDWLNQVKQLPDLYLDPYNKSSELNNEWKMLHGLQCANFLIPFFFRLGLAEMAGNDLEWYSWPSTISWIRPDNTQASPTNFNFIQQASGAYYDNNRLEYRFDELAALNGVDYDSTNNLYSYWAKADNAAPNWTHILNPKGQFSIISGDPLMMNIFMVFMYQMLDQEEHPFDWVFLPYRENITGWDTSRFRIRTDAENQKALTTFLTVALTIAIVATVALGSAIAIKKIQRAKYFKRTEFVGQMDNAMWNGGTLSSAQKRKYLRYQRKLNSTSLLSSGLQSTAATGASGFLENISGLINPSDSDNASIRNILI